MNDTIQYKIPWYKDLSAFDWVWAFIVVIGSVFVWQQYQQYMDVYEKGILAGMALSLIGLGWHWQSTRWFSLVVAAICVFALWLYGSEIDKGDSNFFLKFMLSSQSAIAWMGALYFMATAAFLIGLLAKSEFGNKSGSGLTWAATVMGTVGLAVRWRESYLIDFDFGHIPVSNLYEVFVLLCIISALLYLYYENKFANRQLGFFSSIAISLAVGFVIWYSYVKGGHEIQPLVPALKSYWMKIHVPANFVGYGAFSLSAMLGIAWLIKDSLVARKLDSWADRLPHFQLMEDIVYKSIALGFAFFTIATILGALWAAEAWGSYWSWDPKETWALIVWLNYAAWLHFRLVHGWNGRAMAWWALAGYVVTLFCFLGVNMFLSGLHSYGEL